jgi:23S rRNA (guanosine2251-2'-O)-methyltransferase
MLEKCRTLENPAQTLESLHIMAPADRLPDALAPFVEKATALGVKVKYTPVAEEFLVPSECNHQRIALSIREFPSMEWEDLDEKLAGYSQQEMASRRGCVGVICDQIQDPHNFGAIMRSAAFFGAEFVVFAKDRQAPVSAAVVRTSAGAAAVLDLVKVTNISRVLADLKNRGLWIVATDCGGEAVGLGDVPNDRPYVLVLGNEEKGVRAEILRAADYRVRIPGGQGTLDSLNAAVAAGVALFALNAAPSAATHSKAKAPLGQ